MCRPWLSQVTVAGRGFSLTGHFGTSGSSAVAAAGVIQDCAFDETGGLCGCAGLCAGADGTEVVGACTAIICAPHSDAARTAMSAGPRERRIPGETGELCGRSVRMVIGLWPRRLKLCAGF